MSTAKAPVEVAVGVVVRNDGAVLLGQRPAGKPYAGWWEFPGGKLEAGETVAQALARELHEELGLEVTDSCPWVVREFVYPHAHVRLHFYRVFEFTGEPHGREDQAFAWKMPDAVDVAPMLPATVPVIAWLRLPSVALLCDDPADSPADIENSLAQFAQLCAPQANAHRMLILDRPDLAPDRFELLYYRVREICRAKGLRLLVGDSHAASFAAAAGGVVLGADALHAGCPRPPASMVGARCLERTDLDRCAEIGADFGLIEDPAQSASFAMLADSPIPFLQVLRGRGGNLGQLRREAWRAGAHGLVVTPRFWQD